jgi:DNA helicase-2/ATP-dependent DNA helicase PcrA
MILGEGNVIKGFLKPNLEKKVFVNKKTSYQLGLFDDFRELGSVSRFKNLGFEDKFLENPILKHPKLGVEGAEFLYNFYLLLKRIKLLKNPHSCHCFTSSWISIKHNFSFYFFTCFYTPSF